VEYCPVESKTQPGHKAINMEDKLPLLEKEKRNWNFFFDLPEINRERINTSTVKGTQFLQPLFEFSSACAGCGETPYLKLLTQLFGERMVVANATGCSSIYGANLPTTPWSTNKEGRGPAWANSLFEDNAEFGLGIKLALDQREKSAPVKKSVWIIGGDGWAYDIGYAGLDHVIASGENVNILVLDTEVYSNTGGQTSKATPLGAIAKFSASGKKSAKKNLAQLAINYGTAYVAQIAIGANDSQTVRALKEAEAFPGTSLVIAYCHCIAHGYDMAKGAEQQKNAVKSGYWNLFRYNPLNPPGKRFMLDSKEPSLPLKEFMYKEGRFSILLKQNPQLAEQLLKQAEENIKEQ
jgi:pyruvate-ferredoxin/flavodoxin oxidoreductase